MKTRNGFTLIELLIVIAIIGILAVLVLVVVGNARDKAQEARIKSSVNQSRLVVEDFRDDNGFSYEGIDECFTNQDEESCLSAERAEAVAALLNDINAANGVSVSSIGHVQATERTYCLNMNVVESVTSGKFGPVVNVRKNFCIDSSGQSYGLAEDSRWICDETEDEETYCNVYISS